MGHETNREFEFNDELGDFQVFIDEGEPNHYQEIGDQVDGIIRLADGVVYTFTLDYE